jgi:membrane protein YdbS with pleckstrin-like domain
VAPSSVPSLAPADGEEFRLDPALPRLWTMIGLIVVVPPATAGVVLTAVFGLWLVLPAIVLVATLLPLGIRSYGRRYVATFRCVLGELGLFVERGVWWRSQTFVARHRVQHTDVDQGPLARRFGLATLKVFTAGSQSSEIQVEDLRHADALQLRDALLERHGTGPT